MKTWKLQGHLTPVEIVLNCPTENQTLKFSETKHNVLKIVFEHLWKRYRNLNTIC